ncbi:MAG: ATP-dependent Clp protease proteolytic subunit [Prevotellaceae bacterium]|jgi:membrane-bound serine protease (ClpP class)|nr:ATP-dependent Clp protease proteolytic subunit [Prevotellaceae bacterium]
MRYLLFQLIFLCATSYGYAEQKSVYVIPLHRDIDAPAARIVRKGLIEARALQSDYILLHLNTYGGELTAADSIRTMLLHCEIPTLVFIDNQAASAGALIAIACDSIYMRSGGSIGAATVVDQTGAVVPDKYQSFMRSMMRSTAAAHGKRKVLQGRDTVEVWRRDPLIAEAMVDPRIVVPGTVDSAKVLTFTVDEAIAGGYCEGRAESIDEVLTLAGLAPAVVKKYNPSWLDKIILFLMSPILQGLLLMLIIGGVYFELQSPGIGFPLAAAVVGALLYFAPLYLEGLAENWELLLFIGGLALLAVELFIIPGFGITGIAGILLCITGLLLAMIDNHLLSTPTGIDLTPLVQPLFVLSAGIFGGLLGSIYLSRKLYPTKFFGRIALKTDLTENDGYIGVPQELVQLVGATGTAHTLLRPSGKIIVHDELYDAVAEYGIINKGQTVRITHYETGQLYCIPID